MRQATIYLILSLLLTYPLSLHLTDAVEDRQDALLNVWITAWDGHQLLSDPLHLFDANIFVPYRRSLAYSELLLGNGLLALPITALSGNPVLGYNIALLLSFTLSGLGACLLVVRFTRSAAAGMVAGAIFAFSAYRMTNLAQAQLLTTQWMPFALLTLSQLMHHPRPRHLAAFVLFFFLQAVSSFYYGLLLSIAVSGYLIWETGYRIGLALKGQKIGHRSSVFLFLALCLLLLILLPFARPYFQVQRELGFERSLADSEPFSASLRQYLMVPPRSLLYGHLLPNDDTPMAGGYPVDALFPGFTALALAAWGLVRSRDRTRWFFLLLLFASCCLSLGPRLYLAPGQPADLDLSLPYAWLYAVVPGFKALRAPVRFDALVTLALAVLAGYGVSGLRTQEAGGRGQAPLLRRERLEIAPVGAERRSAPGRPPARTEASTPVDARPQASEVRLESLHWMLMGQAPRSLSLITWGLLWAICLESLVWPAARVEKVPVGDAVPPVYRWLAEQPPGPILELPMAFTPGGPRLDYQYLSTYHWHPTPDGYSGFIPPKHGQIVYEMERFPSEQSVSLLQALGVRYLLLHTDRYPAGRQAGMQAALAQSDDLTPVQRFGADQVYEVRPRSFDPASLAVSGYLPLHAAAGQPYTAYLIVINGGLRSYALPPTSLIRAATTWECADGRMTGQVTADLPLVTSPAGGAAIIPLPLAAPPTPGTCRLTIGEQGGPLGDWALDGMVEVGSKGDEAFPVPARLESWQMPSAVHPGDPLPIHLTWRALGKIDAYYSVYVKLLDAGSNALAGWDGQPGNGAAPTLLWVPGEKIEDTVTLTIPADTPPGDYTVEVGMYRARDLVRCLTLDADGAPLERVELGRVRVGLARQ